MRSIQERITHVVNEHIRFAEWARLDKWLHLHTFIKQGMWCVRDPNGDGIWIAKWVKEPGIDWQISGGHPQRDLFFVWVNIIVTEKTIIP